MTERTCRTCYWWSLDTDGPLWRRRGKGVCMSEEAGEAVGTERAMSAADSLYEGLDWRSSHAHLATAPSFGCRFWEEDDGLVRPAETGPEAK